MGAIYPPSCPRDIDEYDEADLMAGFLAYQKGDPEPGDNRPPGYRWGWANRRRDSQHEDDGHDWIRRAYLANRRLSSTPVLAREGR